MEGITTTARAKNADTRKRTVALDIPLRVEADDRPLSLPEQIAQRLSQEILAGVYPPGGRIPEQRLSEQFQVSRGPVREALRILEHEGVVEILPRRGAQVTSLTVKEVTDIFDIRAALVGLCARLALENFEQEQLAHLKDEVDRLSEIAREDGDGDEYLSISLHLSLFLGRHCGNRRLYEMVRSLARQTARYSALALSTPARRKRSAKIWRSLLRSFRTGDTVGAERAARTLVEESRDSAIGHLTADARQPPPAGRS